MEIFPQKTVGITKKLSGNPPSWT